MVKAKKKSLKTNKIVFKGQYLKRKRNGKGAEYESKNGKLIFQGEYSNSKRNGKGKEYDHNVSAFLKGNI